jgi:acetoin utilization protein AcuC
MNDRRLAFVYAPEVEGLSYPPDCPFKTHRTTLTRRRLLSFGLLNSPGREEVGTRPASRAVLERLHSPRYLDELERAAAGDLTPDGFQMGLGTPDTPVFRDLYTYGAWACGAALTAADLLLENRADIAFSLLGGFHHAMPERAGGFCYLNDVALACHRLATSGRRVAYVDVDAHHGDGVQAVFYGRRDVMTISLHESGRTLYPWGGFEDETGEGEGRGFNVNVSLPAGTYDAAFLRAFEEVTLPLIRAYRPDVVVLELGMDALAGDPLTHLNLTNHAHEAVLRRLLEFERPLLVAGGGGYHVENTVRGWALAWKVCAGEDDEHDLSLGMGGVMLASSEWAGGLRDHELPVTPAQREAVDAALRLSIDAARRNVFPHHGLPLPEPVAPEAPVPV